MVYTENRYNLTQIYKTTR